MTTRTINAKADLTYEEIYEGYANGKSRLPKMLKEIGASVPSAVRTLADFGGAGINILRRRTGGGNATNVKGIGISVTAPVAKLISSSHYDLLGSNYNNTGGVRPSENIIGAEVHAVVKNPFDLIDFVSGVNNAGTSVSSSRFDPSRLAKLKSDGSNIIFRDFTQVLTGTTVDVRVKFGDRVDGGGVNASGLVHDPATTPGLIVAEGEAVLIGGNTAPFNIVDTTLVVSIDGGAPITINYTPDGVASISQVVAETNTAINTAMSPAQPLAFNSNGALAIKSPTLGGTVVVSATVGDDNANLGITGAQTEQGAGTAATPVATDAENIINVAATDVTAGRLTHIRYGTYQFGTLQIFNSINDALPVAYIVHPDLLTDLIAG